MPIPNSMIGSELKRWLEQSGKSILAPTVGAVAVLAVATLVAAAVVWFDAAEHKHRFGMVVQQFTDAADAHALTSISVLSTIASVDQSQFDIDEGDFAALGAGVTSEHNIDHLLFAPIIKFGARQEFEGKQKLLGFQGYEIRDVKGDVVPPSLRAGITAPVTRAEPFGPAMSSLIGVDILSSPLIHDAVNRATATGKTVLRDAPSFLQAMSLSDEYKDSQRAKLTLVAVRPVYRGAEMPKDDASRKRHLRGLYVALMRLGTTWNNILKLHATEDFELEIQRGLAAHKMDPISTKNHFSMTQLETVTVRVSQNTDDVRFLIIARSKPLIRVAFAAFLIATLLGWAVYSFVRSLQFERREARRVSERAAAERLRAEQTLALIGDAVIRTTSDFNITYSNDVANTMFGTDGEDLSGKQLDSMLLAVDEQDDAKPVAALSDKSKKDAALVDGDYVFEDEKSADRLIVNLSRTETDRIEGEQGTRIFVIRDVGVERALAEELEWRASRDELTQLYNRHSFETLVESHIGRKSEKNHALCVLDLDQFKIINDTAGHAAGDEMLCRVASTLRSEMRESDIVARLGGDEFGYLLLNVSENKANIICERIVEVINECRVTWEGKAFQVGASIGIAMTNHLAWDFEELMHNADKACFAAKKRGRGRSMFFRADDALISQRQSDILWINEIPHALETNRFVLDVQTIVAVSSLQKPAEIREILVRMVSEEGEIIGPGEFIPAAERYDLMSRIDRWVISHAFRKIGRTPFEQGNVIFSINLSSRSLDERDLIDFVLDELEKHGVLASQICFELTETAAVSDVGQASQFLRTIREHGFKTALDDFGSGLASFRYLRNFPADFLKLDGSLVVEASNDERSRRLLEGVVDLARDMGLRTVAEGIEDADTLALMKAVGVDYNQGFFLQKPVRFYEPERPPGATTASVTTASPPSTS